MNKFFSCGITLAFLSLLPLQSAPLSTPVSADGFFISGTVVDAVTGSPLANARVEIVPVEASSPSREMITIAGGRFVFENLSGGKYRLMAECQGYLTRSLNEHDQFTTLVSLGTEAPSWDLVFPLPPESSIAGLVTDDRGDALRSATVMLFQTSTREGIITTRLRKQMETDDRGFYSFNHLPEGKYYLAVASQPWYARYPGFSGAMALARSSGGKLKGPDRASGSASEENIDPSLDVAYPVTFYAGVTDPETATAVLLAPGDNEKADIILHAMPSLHVRIRLANPEQLQGNDVTVEQSIFGNHVPISIPTRQTEPGTIELAGIPAGRYSVRTDSLEHQQVITEIREIEVSQSGALSTMVGKTSASLTAIFPGKDLPPNGSLRLWDIPNRTFIEEKIFGRHKFQFQQRLAPGEYEVALVGAPAFFIRRISVDGVPLAGRTIKIKGAEPASLSIAIEHGTAQVAGTAIRADQPAAGVMVVLVPDDPESNRALLRREESNTDGSFVFSMVAPGKYTLLAIDNGWDLEWANPKALKPYLGKGEPVQAVPNGKQSNPVKVQVQ